MVQVASTVTETRITARRDSVVTVTTSTFKRLVVPSALPSVTPAHLPTASMETRRPGVTLHSSNLSTATHQRMLPAVRRVPPTALDHRVRLVSHGEHFITMRH